MLVRVRWAESAKPARCAASVVSRLAESPRRAEASATLRTSSRFGNHLYRGDATLFFVVVDLAIASTYGALAVTGLRRLRAEA